MLSCGLSDSHYVGRLVWCRTSPRVHGKIFKLISDTVPKGRDRVGAGRGRWEGGRTAVAGTGAQAAMPLTNCCLSLIHIIYSVRTSRRIQRAFAIKNTQLLLYGEITATYCENHKKLGRQFTIT